ncbi:hypothetical protein, partial [Paenibacillus sp. 598K]|uniref:hypothetical protein n=1 Tax=Paenibacillus sp. 598K TaxID=1117987 RepID=UPI00162A7F3E
RGLLRTRRGFRHIAAAMAEREARETRPQVEGAPTERRQAAYGRLASGRRLAEAVAAGASLAAESSLTAGMSRLAWR